VDEECLDVAVEGIRKNTGIPVGMSRIFRMPYAVTDKCYTPQKSLNSGLIKQVSGLSNRFNWRTNHEHE
jgi:hypothetical protein